MTKRTERLTTYDLKLVDIEVQIHDLARKQWPYACPCCGYEYDYLDQVTSGLHDNEDLNPQTPYEYYKWAKRLLAYYQDGGRFAPPDTLGMICSQCGWERDYDEESEHYLSNDYTGPNGTDIATYRKAWLNKQRRKM